METALMIVLFLMAVTLIAGFALWIKMTFFRKQINERDLNIAY